MSTEPQNGLDGLEPVLRAFGLEAPREIARLGGTASRKWSVTCPAGRFVLRIRPGEFADPGSTQFDHEIMLRLSNAGFPVPQPQLARDGRTWVILGNTVYECLGWIAVEPSSIAGIFSQTLSHEGHKTQMAEQCSGADADSLRGLGSFLARFHAVLGTDLPPGKEGRLREDHPDLMKPYLAELLLRQLSELQRRDLGRMESELARVRENLDIRLLPRLPHAVIHGDIHPGNIHLAGAQVAALYDFDYLCFQPRARDLSDGLIFFASQRESLLRPDDIRCLAQPFVPDLARSRMLIEGYEGVSQLVEEEWQALPWLMRSRWIQTRLRGARKVVEDQKLAFVLDRFFEVTDWLDREGENFFQRLRQPG